MFKFQFFFNYIRFASSIPRSGKRGVINIIDFLLSSKNLKLKNEYDRKSNMYRTFFLQGYLSGTGGFLTGLPGLLISVHSTRGRAFIRVIFEGSHGQQRQQKPKPKCTSIGLPCHAYEKTSFLFTRLYCTLNRVRK